MRIYNGLDRDLYIYSFDQVNVIVKDGKRRYVLKNDDCEPIHIITVDKPLTVKIKYMDGTEILPRLKLVEQKIEGIDPIPSDCDLVIVSTLYARIATQMKLSGWGKLVVPHKTVYNSNGDPVGCLSLKRLWAREA